MDLSRKDFIKLLVVFGAGGVAAACGKPQGSANPDCAANGAHDEAISGNHGHVLSVPAADFSAGADKTYSIQGTAAHDHTITITSTQFTQLLQNQPVTITSTTTLSHNHNVTVGCL